MAPWAQIAKPFSIHFAVNCIKTVAGSGLVGYGVAWAVLLRDFDDDGNDDDDDKSDGENKNKTKDGADTKRSGLVRGCIGVATTIGLGLFLCLPSLASQVVWETMIPAITATDVAYDLGTENVRSVLPRWNGIKIPTPKLSSLVAESTKEAVGGLIRGGGGRDGTGNAD